MTAIYARQSVEKADSISIETQVQICISRLPREEEYEVYADQGWSGATNHRPELERMMQRIRSGYISCVAVYRLDRLGRSLRNFLELLDEFRSYHVVLMAEHLTLGGTDAYGRLLVGLMMSFAELERDTIIRRVTDNYYERGKHGMFLGGIAPFGLQRTQYQRNGKWIKGLVSNPDTVGIVQWLFEQSAYKEWASLGELARQLNRRQILTVRGNPWSSASVGRLLHNPVYVRADEAVYRYYKSRGCMIESEPEQFDGVHGMYLYGTAKGRTATKYANIGLLTASIAPHEGIVDSTVWLACQHRLDQNHTLPGHRPKATWLSGLMHCADCGYACTVTGGKNKRYLTCGGRKMGICTRKNHPITAEEVEGVIYRYLCGAVKRLDSVSVPITERLKQLEQERESCINAFSQVSALTAAALDERICRLEQEHRALLQCSEARQNRILLDFPIIWKQLDQIEKHKVAGIFVRDIRISEKELHIIEC